MSSKPHNLDIHSYSINELFGLFDLTFDITVEDLKRAKKKVLMTHPDKSRLPPEYFLFYKKAFDIVIMFYNNQNKQNQEITEDKIQYSPTIDNATTTDKSVAKNVEKSLKEMGAATFQSKFNTLFEENMREKPNTAKNEWFSSDAPPAFQVADNVTAKNMGSEFERIKETQRGLVRYKGIETLHARGTNANSLYEDDKSDDDYVTSDPFSKLKFDDLRKVHKDQTVFAVGERDFEKVKQYGSVDSYMQERVAHKPLDKKEAENVLNTQNEQYKQSMMRKQYEDELRTKRNEVKQKTVLGSFLRLGN